VLVAICGRDFPDIAATIDISTGLPTLRLTLDGTNLDLYLDSGLFIWHGAVLNVVACDVMAVVKVTVASQRRLRSRSRPTGDDNINNITP
jgi:hypothetical protein